MRGIIVCWRRFASATYQYRSLQVKHAFFVVNVWMDKQLQRTLKNATQKKQKHCISGGTLKTRRRRNKKHEETYLQTTKKGQKTSLKGPWQPLEAKKSSNPCRGKKKNESCWHGPPSKWPKDPKETPQKGSGNILKRSRGHSKVLPRGVLAAETLKT